MNILFIKTPTGRGSQDFRVKLLLLKKSLVAAVMPLTNYLFEAEAAI